MTYQVEITESATGVTRVLFESGDWPGDYLFSDGNYACDCNRRLLFARAHHEPEEDLSTDCSQSKYTVVCRSSEGDVLYSEAES